MAQGLLNQIGCWLQVWSRVLEGPADPDLTFGCWIMEGRGDTWEAQGSGYFPTGPEVSQYCNTQHGSTSVFQLNTSLDP